MECSLTFFSVANVSVYLSIETEVLDSSPRQLYLLQSALQEPGTAQSFVFLPLILRTCCEQSWAQCSLRAPICKRPFQDTIPSFGFQSLCSFPLKGSLKLCNPQILNLLLTTNRHYYPHFINEELEAQRGQLVCLQSQSLQRSGALDHCLGSKFRPFPVSCPPMDAESTPGCFLQCGPLATAPFGCLDFLRVGCCGR